MTNISVFCHEFGHMLGLPDLYARPEKPGMEGVGIWCAMSNQAGNGRPQHFCAWSKEKLGWVKPAVIDPTVKQKLVLAPDRGLPEGVLQGPGASRTAASTSCWRTGRRRASTRACRPRGC